MAFSDVVVLLPGILGSALQREGRDVWNLSGGALFGALRSFGRSVSALALPAGAGADPDDGVVATELLRDVHLIPGLWKIDGYTKVARTLSGALGLVPGASFFEFPYDWRKDNRAAARALAKVAPRWLHDWRKSSGARDAKLVLVAHSMGGLVSRYFLDALGGWEHTRALVTFGTPFRGAPKALDVLANGFAKKLGPIPLLDLTAMVRSLPSVYQLLPIWPCVSLRDGRTVRPAELGDAIAGFDAGKAAEALAFHREIEEKAAANAKDPRWVPYAIHPIVGTHQSTLQGARGRAGGAAGLEVLGTDVDGTDNGGDGTVPRVSAMPLEKEHHARAMFAAKPHASLQNAQEVLAHVEGVLSGASILLDRFRLVRGGAAKLALDVADSYDVAEPVTVRVRGGDRPLALTAQVVNVDTGELRPAVALRGERGGAYEAELGPLPEGIYRVLVKGPGAEGVADLFAVFDSERVEDRAEAMAGNGVDDEGRLRGGGKRGTRGLGKGLTRSPGLTRGAGPTHGRGLTRGPGLTRDPGLTHSPDPRGPGLVKKNGGRRAANGGGGGGAGARGGEGRHVTRHPSITPVGEARAGAPLTLTIDLRRERDEATDARPMMLDAGKDDWKELLVEARVASDGLVFAPGADRGPVTVRNGRDSEPLVVTGTVRDGLAPGTAVEVLVSFVHAGRVSGHARRAIPLADGAPASARATALRARRGRAAPPAAPEAEGAMAIDTAAAAPRLTVEIFRTDRADPSKLFWSCTVSEECPGLPGRMAEPVDLGASPEKFFAGVVETCTALKPGAHQEYFAGLGKLIYGKAPPSFRAAYQAVRAHHGAGFPVQIITDDPHVPWELMLPDVAGAKLLAIDHPVARWLVDYKSAMTARLPEGTIVTVAPDYSKGFDHEALPSAQEESKELVDELQAVSVPGTRDGLFRVLEDKLGKPVSVLHFAGHGDYSDNPAAPSRIYLEDGALICLEVRTDRVVLGQHHRPLVVLNACEVGGAGDVLGAMGGWAEVFLERRFAGVVAPLWPVYDEAAQNLVGELMHAVMKERRPVGEALRDIRARLGAKSPTYLSYVFVGDVMARLAP